LIQIAKLLEKGIKMKNLQELYKIQAGLKTRIGYNGPDKFERMILAMIVEFSEAANDWQGFKYWKKNNEPKETLLEEYVDGLHFVLEAGLDLKEIGFIKHLPEEMEVMHLPNPLDITGQFKQIIYDALTLEIDVINHSMMSQVNRHYYNLFKGYLKLGALLGFTDEQIAAAYLKKVAVNHERQNNGY
jgi:dimeric dUTPase (all-alpha-NTP-PPase superfamily)